MKIRNTKPKKSFSRSERKLEFTRILTFSDGVFAIAMTLLVVTIQIPDIPSGLVAKELPDAIGNLWTSLFSYFLSFAVISLFWVIHHRMFARIARYDMGLVALNLALLAFVALLPFPTELLGEYGDQAISVVVYASNLAVIGFLQLWLYLHAVKGNLLRQSEGSKEVRAWIANLLVSPLVFSMSIPIALFIDSGAAQYFWILAFLLRPPLDRWLERAENK